VTNLGASGNGQNFDRPGRAVLADAAFNFTLPPRRHRGLRGAAPPGVADRCFHPPCKPPKHEPVPITVTTLDLDASLIFSGGPGGGPGAKRAVIDAFLADGEAKHGVRSVYHDAMANLELLACVRPGCRSRAALREAGIETRRE